MQNLLVIFLSLGTVDFWWTKSIDEIFSQDTIQSLNVSDSSDLVTGQDILDIWFDSGISWYCTLNEPKIADLYLEGVDQLTGWFQSSLMTSIALRDCAPYRSIFVHGFTVDEKGHKMSKSLGNVISPKDIIGKYGIDTMRWWIAAHSVQHTIVPVSHSLLEGSAEIVQKLRSLLRYMNGVIGKSTNDSNNSKIGMTHLDRYMLDLLQKFDSNITQLYGKYQYNYVTAAINNFVTNDVSGMYVHLNKDRLYCGSDTEFKTIQNVILAIYKIVCKTAWPIIPHLIEESWSYFKDDSFYKTEIKLDLHKLDENFPKKMTEILDVKHQLYQRIKDVNTWMLDVKIRAPQLKIDTLKLLHPTIEEPLEDSELTDIFQVSSIALVPDFESSDVLFEIVKEDKALCPRCRRFNMKNTDDLVCIRCKIVLKTK